MSQSRPPVSRSTQRSPRHSFTTLEQLENRTLMCWWHGDPGLPAPLTGPVVEVPAQQATTTGGTEAAADIIWTNRGSSTNDSDRFNSVFGANANVARAVVDAVIVAYERMIGSFNYSDGSSTYSLSVSMASSGTSLGASANLTGSLNGKAKTGAITMGRGGGGTGGGWFLDPTPNESSEFLGTIVNAFSGDATPGGPAFNQSDFYTVVAAEMTHCMGLFGSTLPGWASHTTNTFAPDTQASPGQLWVFQGPSIKHLLTSDNGGFQDWGSAIHSSEPGNSVAFGGDTYIGAQDQGNAFYEKSRRYMINNTFALMFKDAYNFSSVDPAQFGTFYATLNSTTGEVTVRGGSGTSVDNIVVSRSGSTLTVSVDVGNDVPGSGALAGNGDLPAFVTNFDASAVSRITITAGGGNDTIAVNGVPAGTIVDVRGEAGDDAITVGGDVAQSVQGNVLIDGGDGDDTISISETAVGSSVSIQASAGNDDVAINSDDTGNAAAQFVSSFTSLDALTIGNGGSAIVQAAAQRVLRVASLSINSTGFLDLADGALVYDYATASPISVVKALLGSGFANGLWNGNGIRSTTAASDAVHRTALGYAETASIFSTFPATFAGQQVDDTAIVVKCTLYGDANLDGTVNVSDFTRLASNFGSTGTNWSSGNFDYDDDTDVSDFTRLANTFGGTGLASDQADALLRSIQGAGGKKVRAIAPKSTANALL